MSRHPPAAVARALRQEAGFGCCMCGLPIVQYHHIVEWHDEQHFRPEDMMALCPTHHDMAGKALSEEEQRRIKADPFNRRRGLANGLLHVPQSYCALEMGSVIAVNEGPFLMVDDEVILSLSLADDSLLLSAHLYDESGALVAAIQENEWTTGDPFPWDIEAGWQRLVVRQRAGKVALDLDAQSIPPVLRGSFWHKGRHIKIGKDISLSNKPMTLTIQHLALVGSPVRLLPGGEIDLGSKTDGVLVSCASKRERLWRAKQTWLEIKSKRAALLDEPAT